MEKTDSWKNTNVKTVAKSKCSISDYCDTRDMTRREISNMIYHWQMNHFMTKTRTEILKEIEELNKKRLQGMVSRSKYYKEYERIKLELENLKKNE